jgi:hypothetical protein
MELEWVTFVETDAFTSRIARFGLEAVLRTLQVELVESPERGSLDPGTGGLRKIRMASPARSKGKRGGTRVHYLWLPYLRRIYLVFVYGKDEQDSLTAGQKAVLRQVVRRIVRDAE